MLSPASRPRDDEPRDARRALGGVDGGKHGVEIGISAVGDEALLPVQHVVIAVEPGSGRQGAGVGSRFLLGEAEGRRLARLVQRGQEALLLLLRAREQDGGTGQRVDPDHPGQGHAAGGQFLGDHRRRHHVQPLASVRRRAGEVHQAGGVGLADDLRGIRRFPVVLLRHRRDLPAGEVAGQLLQGLLPVVQTEADHGLPPCRSVAVRRRPSRRCGVGPEVRRGRGGVGPQVRRPPPGAGPGKPPPTSAWSREAPPPRDSAGRSPGPAARPSRPLLLAGERG